MALRGKLVKSGNVGYGVVAVAHKMRCFFGAAPQNKAVQGFAGFLFKTLA